MKKPEHLYSYLLISLLLGVLGFIFFKLPFLRIITSIIMGTTYFLWGVVTHYKDKTLHLSIVLEYLSISLISTIILIFLSLRA